MTDLTELADLSSFVLSGVVKLPNLTEIAELKEKARGTSKMGAGKRSSADSVTPTAPGLSSFI